MDEGTTIARARAQSFIIKRPRLTKLLDESEARIILLVAPAGYGKTTLAREWLEGKPGVAWYSGGPAMADVAALVAGLAEAMAPAAAIPNRPRNRGLAPGAVSPASLARALAPATTPLSFLVVDDYHHALDSPDADEFLSTLIELADCRVLITSRVRPRWITARMSIYGDALIVAAESLAFDPGEAQDVLRDAPSSLRERVLAVARGWPAVIRLAAMRRGSVDPVGSLSSNDLYDFFAEDLFRRADVPLRDALFLLALAGDIDPIGAARLLGDGHESFIASGSEGGFLTCAPNGIIEIHPLVRGFLLAKLREVPADEIDVLLGRVVRSGADDRRWDRCLSALEEFPRPHLILEAIQDSVSELLEVGRMATVRRWLELAKAVEIEHPILLFAEAEVALRQGENKKAQVLGERAGALLDEPELSARAHVVAARAAHLGDSAAAVTGNAEAAEALAESADTRVEALWIHFSSSLERELPDVRETLERLRGASGGKPHHELRVRTAQGVMRLELDGEVGAAAAEFERGMALLPYIDDVYLLTSYLNHSAFVLCAASRYEEALEVSHRQLSEARSNELEFAIDHGLVTQSTALIGLRRLRAAKVALDEVMRSRSDRVQQHAVANAYIQQAKLRIALGDVDRASTLLQREPHADTSSNLRAEFLAYRALVDAARGSTAGARRAIAEVEAVSRYPIAMIVRDLALGVLGLREEGAAAGIPATKAVSSALERGHMDSVVTACRAFPELARLSAQADGATARALSELFVRSHDWDLGRRAGLEMPRELRKSAGLSPREREVYEHLIQGRSNRDIATALFISESTTKVHIRHIFEKLGVHSRAEAALLAAREDES